MAGTIPADVRFPCPRCKFTRLCPNISAGGLLYVCAGCEWQYTLGTQSPTGTSNAAISTPASANAISVASGGASFTSGMYLLYDTGLAANAEVVQVVGTATGTSIPVPAGSFAKAHSSAAAFGQLLVTPANNSTGQDAVPAAPGWGF